MADMSKVQAGPVLVSLGAREIGHTEGGVTFRSEPVLRECRADVLGGAVTDLVHLGARCEVKMRVAEWVLENLEAAIPSGTDSSTYLGLGRTPGLRLSSVAQQMTLHPAELASEETDYDVVLWKAVAAGAAEVGFGAEGDRVFEVTFLALPDATKTDGELIGKIGSPE